MTNDMKRIVLLGSTRHIFELLGEVNTARAQKSIQTTREANACWCISLYILDVVVEGRSANPEYGLGYCEWVWYLPYRQWE